MEKKGFTLIEMVVVLAVIAILAAILFPTIAKHITDSKITRATNEEQVITAAVMMLYKDTGKWPNTNQDGPSGIVNRLLSGVAGDAVPTGIAPNARPGAANWGTWNPAKNLSDFLVFNNPDDDIGAVNQNQLEADYPVTGEFAWKGPYIDQPRFLDPWGNQYVISARYFPGSTQAANHTVLILSAGKDGLWSTSFLDTTTRLTIPADIPYGPHESDGNYIHDDIGMAITTNN